MIFLISDIINFSSNEKDNLDFLLKSFKIEKIDLYEIIYFCKEILVTLLIKLKEEKRIFKL